MSDRFIQGGFADWMRALTEGKKEFPTSEGDRHHYVAQFQLTKFRGKNASTSSQLAHLRGIREGRRG